MSLDSSKVLYSGGNNDECYTPDYAVKPILEYIPKDVTVWCPFDTEESQFVKLIGERIGKENVEYSHLDKGQDFFQYQPKHWDIIISNPPFSNKKKFFKKALDLGKPFALIMTNAWLNDSAPKKLFKDAGKDLQLLMFEERMEFKNGNAVGRVNNKVTFSSSYYCWNFLPKQIIMGEMIKVKQPPITIEASNKIVTPLTQAFE